MQPVVLPSAQPSVRAVVQPTVQRSLQAGKESPVLSLPKDGNLQPAGAASNHFLLLLGGKELHLGWLILELRREGEVGITFQVLFHQRFAQYLKMSEHFLKMSSK